MKILGIIVIIIGISLTAYFFWKKNEVGDSEVAHKFAKTFIETYVTARSGENVKDLKYKLTKWKYENKHYLLDIEAHWTESIDRLFYTSTCQAQQDIHVIISSNAKVYSYNISNENSCSAEHKVATVAGASVLDLFKLNVQIQNKLENP